MTVVLNTDAPPSEFRTFAVFLKKHDIWVASDTKFVSVSIKIYPTFPELQWLSFLSCALDVRSSPRRSNREGRALFHCQQQEIMRDAVCQVTKEYLQNETLRTLQLRDECTYDVLWHTKFLIPPTTAIALTSIRRGVVCFLWLRIWTLYVTEGIFSMTRPCHGWDG